MQIAAIAIVFLQTFSEILHGSLFLQEFLASELQGSSQSSRPSLHPNFVPSSATLSFLLPLQLPVSLRAVIMLALRSDFELEEGRDRLLHLFLSFAPIPEFSTLHTLNIVGLQYIFV